MPPEDQEPHPCVPADLLGYADRLTPAETAALARLRRFLREHAEPVLEKHWEAGTAPEHLRHEFAQAGFVRPHELKQAGETVRPIFAGFRSLELSRTDSSLSILIGGQISMFSTLMRLGLPAARYEQIREDIETFRMTGCFALTEPEHGSDIAGGMSTRARRRGDAWTIDGEKRWIGNAAHSQYVLVPAKDEDDGGLGVFLVPTDAPGVSIRPMRGKTAVRMVQNAHITFDGVQVPGTARLPRLRTFQDLGRAFRILRPDVVWNAAGLQIGAYEHALAYTRRREQFGRPIASFQLVQDKLVRMLGNVTASLGVAVRLAERAEEQGEVSDAEAALGKAWVCARMRETAALGRELLGGNGILLEHRLARFHADAEALYTFEGTHEVNTLIVGREITGYSAFTA